MQDKFKKYQRRSIRLKQYDYSTTGFYFITICTWKHLCLFGKIEKDRMIINKSGEITEKEWYRTGELRANIKLHEFIIMPNHMHGIIEITNNRDTTRRGTACRARFAKPQQGTISTMIRSYKSAVTKQIRDQSNDRKLKIWQRNYYEHIIRNEEAYLKISEYIQNNPLKWKEDKYFV